MPTTQNTQTSTNSVQYSNAPKSTTIYSNVLKVNNVYFSKISWKTKLRKTIRVTSNFFFSPDVENE